MAAAPDYALKARLLDEAEQNWIQQFAAGEEWWSHEVTDFLRHHAMEMGRQGLNTTILFSFPGFHEVVGFVTASNASLLARDVGLSVTLPPGSPARVPAVLIPYMGVDRRYRRSGHFGQEIHMQLLEAISTSWAATRLIYLECWEENAGGVAFWRRMGYVAFHRFQTKRPDCDDNAWLLRMVYDRFAIRVEQRP